MQCELCGQEPVTDRVLHAYGAQLCQKCANGSLDNRLTHRGIATVLQTVERRTPRGNTYFVYRILASLDGAASVHLTFQKKSLGSRLGALFSRPVIAGDPLFDSRVAASGQPREALQRILASDGAQTAILELVQFRPFAVRGGAINLEFDDSTELPMKPTAIHRNAVLVLHHLAAALRRG